jgi:hypothetical protein
MRDSKAMMACRKTETSGKYIKLSLISEEVNSSLINLSVYRLRLNRLRDFHFRVASKIFTKHKSSA